MENFSKIARDVVSNAIGTIKAEQSTQSVMDQLVEELAELAEVALYQAMERGEEQGTLAHFYATELAGQIAEQAADAATRKKVRGKIEVPLARACKKAELGFKLSLSVPNWDAPHEAHFSVKELQAAPDVTEEQLAAAAKLLELCGGNKSLAAKALAVAGSK